MARSLESRWNRIKNEVTLADLSLDVIGKVLVGLGLGALLAERLAPSAWWLVGAGLAMSLVVKAKYWKRFWR